MAPSKNPHRMPVCRRTLESLRQGQKTVFLETDDRIFTRFNPGDRLKMFTEGHGTVTKIIVGMRRYRTLADMLDNENLQALGYETREAAEEFFGEIFEEISRDQVLVAFDLAPTERNQRRNAAKKSQD